MGEEDIRTIKSRQAIVQALLILLEAKPFRKITVSDICKTAVVGRSTFYAHFEDKYQLLAFSLGQELEALKTTLLTGSPKDALLNIFTDIHENKRFYKNLLLADMSDELQRIIQSALSQFFSNILNECRAAGIQLAGNTMPPLVAYYSNGTSGLIVWWIENDFTLSEEEITQYLYNLLGNLFH